MNRLDYVKYDEDTARSQEYYKDKFTGLVNDIEALPGSRAASLALTKIEEAYMWVGKALRDLQIKKNGPAPLNESREP